jgi:hypothetical protein
MVSPFRQRVPSHHPMDVQILLALELIMGDLTALNAAVADNTTAVIAVAALVATLKSATDQAAIDAATTQVVANNATLAGLTPPPVTPASS